MAKEVKLEVEDNNRNKVIRFRLNLDKVKTFKQWVDVLKAIGYQVDVHFENEFNEFPEEVKKLFDRVEVYE